jgi:pimeloyl-ACP methyl ester carboxylesterase
VVLIQFGEHLARTSLQLVQGFDRRWVVTSVGRVHLLERHGPGPLPPVVLLHGLSSAGVHYLRVTPHLKAVSRVLLPDLPGHGFSDMPASFTGASMLGGLIEALDEVIDRPVVLAGTSLGGYMAIRYALVRPQNVAGLLVAAPAGAAMAAEELQALRARFELKTHRDAVQFVDALFARPKLARHVIALGLRKYFSLPQTVAVLQQMQLAQLLTPAELARLTMPMLFLWGAAERILPSTNLEFFRAHLPPHARIEVLSHWGHSGFLDDPKGFALSVVRFAAQLIGMSHRDLDRLDPEHRVWR